MIAEQQSNVLELSPDTRNLYSRPRLTSKFPKNCHRGAAVCDSRGGVFRPFFFFGWLSPGPAASRWWRRPESNRRPSACKADALPIELRPLAPLVPRAFADCCLELPTYGIPPQSPLPVLQSKPRTVRLRVPYLSPPEDGSKQNWWAYVDLNHRPPAYQADALTN